MSRPRDVSRRSGPGDIHGEEMTRRNRLAAAAAAAVVVIAGTAVDRHDGTRVEYKGTMSGGNGPGLRREPLQSENAGQCKETSKGDAGIGIHTVRSMYTGGGETRDGGKPNHESFPPNDEMRKRRSGTQDITG